MATYALTDCDIFVDGLDYGSYGRKASVTVDVAERDITTFASAGWTEVRGVLKSSAVELEGFQDYTAAAADGTLAGPDPTLLLTAGSTYTLTAVPMGATVGAVSYFTQGMLRQLTPLEGDVTEVGMAKYAFTGRTPVVRGQVERTAPITATGSSAGVNFTTLPAGQRMWAAAHVLSASGTTPSCTLKVQSGNDAGFSSPIDRITFTAMTARGGQFGSYVGPSTHPYWRFNWTVSGTSPSFVVVLSFGIQ